MEGQNIATSKEVLTALEAMDIPSVYAKMVDYAQFKMSDHHLENAEEIVGDVFEKIVSGERSWNRNKTFKEILFGSVKSLVSNYNRKLKEGRRIRTEDYEIEDYSDNEDVDASEQMSVNELKSIALRKLEDYDPPPDYIEKIIFECWMDGITKTREVVEFLEIDKKEVNKAIKRLERKLGPTRELFNSMRHG